MESDLGTRLEWVATAHYNTEHPHVHVALRGITDLNQPWGTSDSCTSCGKCVQVCPTGALYTKGASHVSYLVTDGNLVTGQNPASSAAVAKKISVLARNGIPTV